MGLLNQMMHSLIGTLYRGVPLIVVHSTQVGQPIKNLSHGRLEQVEVNIEGVKTKAYFEVIEIMDDSDPYPTLLGIDWAFDNNVVLNLKK
jgi:hypothetical protein